jgi:hypothetical protein
MKNGARQTLAEESQQKNSKKNNKAPKEFLAFWPLNPFRPRGKTDGTENAAESRCLQQRAGQHATAQKKENCETQFFGRPERERAERSSFFLPLALVSSNDTVLFEKNFSLSFLPKKQRREGRETEEKKKRKERKRKRKEKGGFEFRSIESIISCCWRREVRWLRRCGVRGT